MSESATCLSCKLTYTWTGPPNATNARCPEPGCGRPIRTAPKGVISNKRFWKRGRGTPQVEIADKPYREPTIPVPVPLPAILVTPPLSITEPINVEVATTLEPILSSETLIGAEGPPPLNQEPDLEMTEPLEPEPEPVNATRSAKKFAAEKGVDLSTVTGSGRDGRIHKDNVEAALAAAESDNPITGGE